MTRRNIIGCLLGTAFGDALGLPYEGLPPRRAANLLGPPDRFRFAFGRGMTSDDTEHTCLVAQSLLDSHFEPAAFERALARRLRIWFLTLPAGLGMATLKACLRLSAGISPARSGVMSAGNGPAMRAAILGAVIDDSVLLFRLNRISTRITHLDLRAEAGSLAVAIAAQQARSESRLKVKEFLNTFDLARRNLDDQGSEMMVLLQQVAVSVQQGQSTADYAVSIGLARGITGFVHHSVPLAIHAALLCPDHWLTAVQSVIRCGGDADTTGAITGGIVGCGLGPDCIPPPLLQTFCDAPRSVGWIETLGSAFPEASDQHAPSKVTELSFAGLMLRNFVFLLIVVFHGLRRLLPPY